MLPDAWLGWLIQIVSIGNRYSDIPMLTISLRFSDVYGVTDSGTHVADHVDGTSQKSTNTDYLYILPWSSDRWGIRRVTYDTLKRIKRNSPFKVRISCCDSYKATWGAGVLPGSWRSAVEEQESVHRVVSLLVAKWNLDMRWHVDSGVNANSGGI